MLRPMTKQTKKYSSQI